MKKILVIDDDEQFNRMICLILSTAGYETSPATDGADGLKLFRNDRYDLVITDIYMPEKEGLETIMELRAADQGVKILVMTGGSPQLSLEEVFSAAEMFGADAMLPKPFDLDTFLRVVSDLLGGAVSGRGGL